MITRENHGTVYRHVVETFHTHLEQQAEHGAQDCFEESVCHGAKCMTSARCVLLQTRVEMECSQFCNPSPTCGIPVPSVPGKREF